MEVICPLGNGICPPECPANTSVASASEKADLDLSAIDPEELRIMTILNGDTLGVASLMANCFEEKGRT